MIEPATLARVAEILAASESRTVGDIAKVLKAELDLVVSTCDEDDICGVKPLAETPGVNLYLLSSSGACLGLTRDPEMAIGVVLAQVTEDDED